MNTSTKASAPTAQAVAAMLKGIGGRLMALKDKLDAVGDGPVPADIARDLAELAAAIRAAVEPTPPSATATDKRHAAVSIDGWPKDMASTAPQEPAWGRDPEGIRHG